MLYHIKANLPETEEDYINGNGEGVLVLIQEDARDAYLRDDKSGVYIGILDNDSIYYPNMVHGMALAIEMRGEQRPVVPFDFLNDYFGFIRRRAQ